MVTFFFFFGDQIYSIDTPSEVENTNKCNSAPCETKKKSNILVPIVSSVGGLALLLLAAAGILIAMKRKEKQGNNIYSLLFDIIKL